MRDPTTEHKPEMRGNLLICISKMSYIEDITLNYMHVIFWTWTWDIESLNHDTLYADDLLLLSESK